MPHLVINKEKGKLDRCTTCNGFRMNSGWTFVLNIDLSSLYSFSYSTRKTLKNNVFNQMRLMQKPVSSSENRNIPCMEIPEYNFTIRSLNKSHRYSSLFKICVFFFNRLFAFLLGQPVFSRIVPLFKEFWFKTEIIRSYRLLTVLIFLSHLNWIKG